MSTLPQVVVVFSGKRKSGKDYVTDIIQKRLGSERCCILRISAPLKGQYAKEHNLDFERLLDASEYKEKYRADMITWGEEKRNKDPGFFCRAACADAQEPVWLISDARRKTDVQYFVQTYPSQVLTVRVVATEDVRKDRGWCFTKGIDDAESECGLDDGVTFDLYVHNNTEETLHQDIEKLMTKIQEKSTLVWTGGFIAVLTTN